MRRQSITPWRNMLAAAFLLMSSLGMNSSGMTLFYQPVVQDLGFSQTQFTMYFTLISLSSMVTLPFVGSFLTKHISKMKLILFVSMLINIAGMFCYSLCSSLPAFYAVSIVRGVVYSFTSGIPATMIVNFWFEDKRSFATAFAFLGASSGGVIFTHLSRVFIYTFSWRWAYVALAGAELVIMIIFMLLVTDTPAKEGLQPYREKKPRVDAAVSSITGFSFKQTLRMPLFWLFCVGVFIANVISMGVQQNITNSLMLDKAYTPLAAANILTIYQVVGALLSLIMGWVVDRTGYLKMLIVLMVMQIAGLLFMPHSEMVVFAVLFATLYTCGNKIAGLFLNTMTADIFGMKAYGSIYGVTSFFLMGGMSVGPLLGAMLYDNAGSYTLLWYAAIVLTFVFMPMVLIPYLRRRSGKMPFPEEQKNA